jgi:hypothetical protein
MTNEERAKEIVNDLEEDYSEEFKEGLYHGILITLDSKDIENEEQDKLINITYLKSLGFWNRFRILFKDYKDYALKKI